MRRTDPQPGLPAMYATTCARCDRPIAQGDRIVHHRGAYIHPACCTGSDDE